MSNTNTDFPLSGGEEPDFKVSKRALIFSVLLIIAVAVYVFFQHH